MAMVNHLEKQIMLISAECTWRLAWLAIIAWPLCGAAEVSPAGRWLSIDDVTGKPTAVIEITESAGSLQGRIVKVIVAPGADADPKCAECDGERRNQRVNGMTILWGLRKQDDGYSGGEILDPDNGRIYRCTLRVDDGGKTMQVRGYIGVSLFGRTQRWRRE